MIHDAYYISGFPLSFAHGYIINVDRTEEGFRCSNQNLLLATNDGKVSIGSTNSPFAELDVTGDIRVDNVSCSSDIRYKHDIEGLESALEKILALRGVSYNWDIE